MEAGTATRQGQRHGIGGVRSTVCPAFGAASFRVIRTFSTEVLSSFARAVQDVGGLGLCASRGAHGEPAQEPGGAERSDVVPRAEDGGLQRRGPLRAVRGSAAFKRTVAIAQNFVTGEETGLCVS